MGKKKYIETPELYLKLWNEYVKEVKSKPKLVHDFVGKDGNSVHRERERPLSWDGFELFVMQKGYIKTPDLSEYCNEDNKSYSDYLPLSRAFKKQIKADHIEGGMTNIYNANITASLHGLKNHNETEIKANVTMPIPDIGCRKKYI
jgi:hypothetical protein